MRFFRSFYSGSLFLTMALLFSQSANAAPFYEFASSPSVELNRIYRIDKTTGEVIACQFGLKNQSVGFTLCLSAGEGAGSQEAGDYGLVATRHLKEGGIFRVNYRTGNMSICYVLGMKVVCTPQSSSTNIEIPDRIEENTPK